LNTEKAIKDLGNELAELTGDNYARIRKLESALADVHLLVKLVQRMGRDIATTEARHGYVFKYPYTIIGQREYDAAMHDEEGEPETMESTGAWGHGGPGL